MARTGRPPKQFDVQQFKALCYIQCSLIEIAGVFDCDKDTVGAWCEREFGMSFSEAFKRFSAGGKKSLRRAQFDRALGGNTALLIFLGKQYLGQSDKTEMVQTGTTELKLSYAKEDLNTDDN